MTVTSSANVQVGSGNVHNVISLGSAPAPDTVDAPAGLDNLPLASAVFEGRDLAALAEALDRGSGGTAVGQAVVHGLGGVGKTELAVHYARAFRDRHTLVWWITADTAASVQLGLAALTARLHPASSLADAHSWALGWLQTHGDWLLVLDNVEDLADVEPLLGQVAGRGRVIVTTRRDFGMARWSRLGFAALRLGVLDRAASVRLLRRLTGLDDGDGANGLAGALGDLPLALEQAAAYVSQHDSLGFDGYHRLLTNRFGLVAADPGEGSSTQRTIATIWQASMAAVAARSTLAVQVLRVLAWLGPDALPEDTLSPLADDPVALGDALAVLASFSLVTRGAGAVSSHRLVQAVVREGQIPPGVGGATATAAAAAVEVIRAAIPDTPLTSVADWPRWNQLLPHIDALNQHAGPIHTNTALMDVNNRAASYRQVQGQLSAAIDLFEQVLGDRRRLLGDDHPDTLTSRHNLAYAYHAAGRVAEAIDLFEQVLADRRRLLGDDHPDTLTSRHHVAGVYHAAGRMAEAIDLFEQVLADRRRLLGDGHPDTLTSRHHLAWAYHAAGRVAEAIILYEQVLADYRRVLGDDHPDTLTSRDNLGYALHTVGRVAEAIDLYEQVLADRRRLLGDHHPDTLTSRDNVTYAHLAAGRVAEVIPVTGFGSSSGRCFGPTPQPSKTIWPHLWPASSSLRCDLGLELLGPKEVLPLGPKQVLRNTEAIDLYEQLLADRRRLLGDDHPDTRDTASSLRDALNGNGGTAPDIPL